MCVQRFDDSLNSAIHITYRISLRSSSLPEPRDPLLKVFNDLLLHFRRQGCSGLRSAEASPFPGAPFAPNGQREAQGRRRAPERPRTR
jgi:hypothetical protein